MAVFVSCNGQISYSPRDEGHFVRGDSVKELNGSVMVIYQDSKNVYWFGSWETGVYRYDGVSLINFSTKHGLPNNRIDEIKEDSVGNIYFISCHPQSTIVRYTGQLFSTITATVSDEWTLKSGDMWFRHAYRNEKVYRYDGSILYELTLPGPADFSNNFEIYSIYKDQKGNIWFGTNPVGVCRYDGETFQWIVEEDVTEFRNEGANGVRSIVEDRNGDFWFNTEYRYSIYDSATLGSNYFYSRHASIGGLDGRENSALDEYLSALKDSDGSLWFVTYRNGVWKYDGSIISHYTVRDNTDSITLFSICKDNEDVLWLGTHENGVFQFDGNKFVKFIPGLK